MESGDIEISVICRAHKFQELVESDWFGNKAIHARPECALNIGRLRVSRAAADVRLHQSILFNETSDVLGSLRPVHLGHAVV